MTIRCIDIETTGVDPEHDAVVEIASVDILREGGISNRQETLVRPGIPVPPESSAIHHLIDADLADAPLLEQVINSFKGADAYVAHNCAFEHSFLGKYLGETTWICTYKCALRVWPDLISHSNQALRYHLGLINPHGMDRKTLNPHRALSDVIVTSAIFVEVLKLAKWSDLVQMERRTRPAHCVRFRQVSRRTVRCGSEGLSGMDCRWAERSPRECEVFGSALASDEDLVMPSSDFDERSKL